MRVLPDGDLHRGVNRTRLFPFAVEPDELIIALPFPLPNQYTVVRNRKPPGAEFVRLSSNNRHSIARERELCGVKGLRDERVVADKDQVALRRINERRIVRQNLFGFW